MGTIYRNNKQITPTALAARDKEVSKLSQVIDGSIAELTAEDFGDVTTLGFGCLGGLTNLTELIVPENITYINKFAFYSIPNATSLHFNAINASNNYAALQYGSYGNGYFCIVSTGMDVKGKPITIYIGNKVTQIPKYQFANPSDSGSRFTNLIFDDNSVCTTLNSGCFSGSALTSVILPNSVTTIKSYAFSYCKKLTNATLPSSVTKIETAVFTSCSNLTEITILATTPPTLSSTDAISSATTTIYIPAGTLSAYQSATNWSSFASKFVEMEA